MTSSKRNMSGKYFMQSNSNGAEIKAPIRFAIIPARETSIVPFLLFLNFWGLTGTGFAQPKPVKINIQKPTPSKCAIGFKVNLSLILGVSSPHLTATNAWKNSCAVITIEIAIMLEINDIKPDFVKISNINILFFPLKVLRNPQLFLNKVFADNIHQCVLAA